MLMMYMLRWFLSCKITDLLLKNKLFDKFYCDIPAFCADYTSDHPFSMFRRLMSALAPHSYLAMAATMPESASFVAAQSLRKLKNVSNLENPFTENQKTAVLKHIGRVIAYDTQMYGPMKNKDEKGFKKFVGDVENNELFVKAVSETIGEVNQENVRKFCADPSMSGKIRDNFVRIRQEGLEKQENGLNRNNNQPQIDEANKNKNLGNKNPEAGI